MEVIPLSWDRARIQIDTLGTRASQLPAAASFDIAAFPEGVRHPAEGFSVHEGTEISFILDSEFEVETRDCTSIVPGNSLVIIPVGEPHVTRANKAGRVADFPFTEVQE